MTTLLRSVLVGAALLSVAACKSEVKGGAAAACPGDDPNQVVATYNGKTVTMKDIDQVAGEQLRNLDKQRFKLRQQTVEQFVVQALVKEAAAKQGKSEEQFLRENIDAKVPPPPEDQIAKVFEENKAQMPPGATIESMREQIIGFLTQEPRREVAMKLFEGLKKSANVELKLAPPPEPRVTVEATGPMRGPNDAKITIVEFSDFECPYCSKAEATVDQVMTAYAGKVKLFYRHFPLPFHQNAGKAAEAAACAAEQGKFWEMHKQLFANQTKLTPEDLTAHAAALALDGTKFNECLKSGKMKALVDADHQAGQKAGVTGTPAFFINGVLVSGAQPFAEFERVINQELASAK